MLVATVDDNSVVLRATVPANFGLYIGTLMMLVDILVMVVCHLYGVGVMSE